MTCPLDKTGWRRQMNRLLRAIPTADWDTAAGCVAQRIMALPAWRTAECIAGYLATPTEIATTTLLADARRRGVDVLIPVYHPERQACVPARLEADQPLHTGAFGLLEPVAPRWDETAMLDLILVPGRAFTRQGQRLGRGGGHYDRFLMQLWAQTALRLGLALESQLIDAACWEPHDVRMHWIVTENKVYGREPGADGHGCET